MYDIVPTGVISFFVLSVFLHLWACDRINKMEEPECHAPVSCDEEILNYERLVCDFYLTPKIDGNLDSDDAWNHAQWQKVGHDCFSEREIMPDDDADASFEIACVADMDALYFGFRIWDDDLNDNIPNDSDYHLVDSLEIYLDQCRGKHRPLDGSVPPDTYNGDDIHMLIAAANVNYPGGEKLLIGSGQGHTKGVEVDSEIIEELKLSGSHSAGACPQGWAHTIRG